ncbi:hypothetical protein LTR64_001387 [Lithohypha guttulata]|uniref:uncharacterized protein n=1 Tax=Lithohypha guttulata TaxID=1690604 RepID=UPI00315DFB8F
MNLSSERSLPLTPSPASAGVVAALPSRPPATSTIEDGGIIDHQIAQTNTTPEDTQPHDNEDVHVHSRRPPLTSASTSTPLSTSTSVEPANRFRDRPNGFPTDSKEVEPYFAGESEGLEFLFDQVAPDRPVVGVHYLTPRRTYRHKRPRIYRPSSQELGSHIALPPRPVQQELVKCFCYYVYPTMPVVDLRDFVETFESDTRSFIEKDVLRANHLPPRKVLKEQYYQNAKEHYDSQHEPDKAVLIACCCLLSTWYVDLEDRDGSWYWIGTGISLSHTIGLHRAANWTSMPSRPFSSRTRSLWRRIWWCIFSREAWLAQGFGRPMRICIDDCDESFPDGRDMAEDTERIDPMPTSRYIPIGMQDLAEAWLVLVHLSAEVADILTMHYRPRSPLPTPHTMRTQEGRLLRLRARIPHTNVTTPKVVLLHICHLEMYFNAALILLYRPLIAATPEKVMELGYVECRNECVSKAKATAADTTNILNKLMSINGIEQTPSSLTSAIMTAMQILVFEMRTSGVGLAKSYAAHQLDLHQLVLGHLRKTYWTADLTHNLFIEVLKILNGDQGSDSAKVGTHENATSDSSRDELVQQPQDQHRDNQNVQHAQGLAVLDNGQNMAAHASLDDFFGIFNPFMGLPGHGDEYR